MPDLSYQTIALGINDLVLYAKVLCVLIKKDTGSGLQFYESDVKAVLDDFVDVTILEKSLLYFGENGLLGYMMGGEDGIEASFDIFVDKVKSLDFLAQNLIPHFVSLIETETNKTKRADESLRDILRFNPERTSSDIKQALDEISAIKEKAENKNELRSLLPLLQEMQGCIESVSRVNNVYYDVYSNIIGPVKKSGKEGARATAIWGICGIVLTTVFSIATVYFTVPKSNNDTHHVTAEKQKMLLDEVRNAFFTGVFDPQPDHKDRTIYKYEGTRPLGIDKTVRTGDVFQDFSSEFNVQSMWADPEAESCRIKANISFQNADASPPKKLSIDFVRSGYGCDITIKPKNNQALHVGESYKYLAVKLRRGPCKHHTEPLAFHLRFIDARGWHWVWGCNISPETDFPSCSYSLETSAEELKRYHNDDSLNYPCKMRIDDNDEGLVFVFDLTDKSKWALFPNDTSPIPPASRDQRFSTITGIVIEPGIWSQELYDKSKNLSIGAKSNQRFLASLPKGFSEPQSSTLEVLKIYLIK